MARILKSRETDLEEIESLASQFESSLSKDFLSRVRQLQDDAKIERIKAFLEAGRVDLALEEFKEDDSNFLLLIFNLWVAASTLQIKMQQEAISALQQKLFGTKTPLVFDPTNPANAEKLKEISDRLKDAWNQSKQNSILYIINDGLVNNLSAEEIALRIQKFQGLTQNQIAAVLNYERLLRQNAKETLDRALRDKTFDRRVSSDKPLTEKQIQNLVDAYIKNQLNYRAGVIGRSIVGDVLNEAFENSTKQALLDSGLDANYLTKTWRSMRDKRVRFTHSMHGGMDNQTVGIDEYFISPSGARLKHPHDSSAPVSETANCRCRMVIGIKENNQ